MTSLRRALQTASNPQKAAPAPGDTVQGAWTEPEPAIVLDAGPEIRVQAEWQRRKEALVDYAEAVRADLHWDTRRKIQDLLALVADLVRCLPGSGDPGRPAAEAELDTLLGQVAALRDRLLG
jgi:hypothetical protein